MSECNTRPGGVLNAANCDNADNWSAPITVIAGQRAATSTRTSRPGPTARSTSCGGTTRRRTRSAATSATRPRRTAPSAAGCGHAADDRDAGRDRRHADPVRVPDPRAARRARVDVAAGRRRSLGRTEQRTRLRHVERPAHRQRHDAMRRQPHAGDHASDLRHLRRLGRRRAAGRREPVAGRRDATADATARPAGRRTPTTGSRGCRSIRPTAGRGRTSTPRATTRRARRRTSTRAASCPDGAGHLLGPLRKVSTATSDYSTNPCCSFGNDYGDYTGIDATSGVAFCRSGRTSGPPRRPTARRSSTPSRARILIADAGTFDDSPGAGGDGDGALEPGESFRVTKALRNTGTAVDRRATGTLSAPGGSGVTLSQASGAYPAIAIGTAQGNATAFAGTMAAGCVLRLADRDDARTWAASSPRSCRSASGPDAPLPARRRHRRRVGPPPPPPVGPPPPPPPVRRRRRLRLPRPAAVRAHRDEPAEAAHGEAGPRRSRCPAFARAAAWR